MRARLLVTLIGLAVLAGAGGGRDAGADPAVAGYPGSIAALGDSITRAVNSDALGDRPENSWATGTDVAVDSYYSRLLAEHPPIAGNRYNEAVSGAQMEDLDGQAADAVAQDAELVFVLMGANDVCTSSEGTMTSVAQFEARFEAAMATLTGGLPDARIAVVSIPDVYNLWDILKDNSSARFIWSAFGICQSLLADPLSEDPEDVQRRQNVRQRNMDFNDVLHDVCEQYVHCRFDDYTGFNTAFTPSHVSTIDYFHPSLAGQALIAGVAWQTFFDWSDTEPPISDSMGQAEPGGVNITLAATDNEPLAGIEYHTGGGWALYEAPFSLPAGAEITWRAVDVNGNVEATHTCTIVGWSWPPGDDDCDSFTTVAETAIGTDPNVGCALTPASDDEDDDRWPPDFDDSQAVSTVDVFQVLPPHFGTTVPPPSPRRDLDPDGTINTIDVFQVLPPIFGRTCVPQ